MYKRQVCAYNDRPWARSRLWLALFLACYGAAPLLTWDGPYCLLLGAAMMLTTAALDVYKRQSRSWCQGGMFRGRSEKAAVKAAV